ncbi:hypothetical protein [uncultured Lentibacter sp.]|uniref:ImuA family protein n=1 Tax=uncultured Lentibacter sp. TaxID=1659309 RepID=UPI00260352C1|nr:hypothetical protein [uncultured Lentibacter sp.]MCW1956741.1 hypothetical protein [Roseobacter sp.]
MRTDISFPFPLKRACVHEACGNGALGFAAISAALEREQMLWIRERWRSDMVNPVGLTAYLDPALMVLAQVASQTEALAVAEEALRDGAMPLVIVELTRPVTLTAGRRLQLAAQAGKTTGLCLLPEGMGSNAASTRWRCSSVFDSQDSDSTLMHWELIKNKSGTLCDWYVRWTPTKPDPADRLAVVSPPRQ